MSHHRTWLGALGFALPLLAAAPALAGDGDSYFADLYREAAPRRDASGRLPINLSSLVDSVTVNAGVMTSNAKWASSRAQWARITRLAREAPGSLTANDFRAAGFDFLFTDARRAATMGTAQGTEADFLLAVVVAWSAVFELDADGGGITRHGMMSPRLGAFSGPTAKDVYPRDLPALLAATTAAKPAAVARALQAAPQPSRVTAPAVRSPARPGKATGRRR